MDEVPLPRDSQKAYRAGPDAAGATSANLLHRRLRRGQAAAPLALSGLKNGVAAADCCLTPGQGLTAIIPAASGAMRRPTRTRPPPSCSGGVQTARHSVRALASRAGEARPSSLVGADES